MQSFVKRKVYDDHCLDVASGADLWRPSAPSATHVKQVLVVASASFGLVLLNDRVNESHHALALVLHPARHRAIIKHHCQARG